MRTADLNLGEVNGGSLLGVVTDDDEKIDHQSWGAGD
jgi:hypothetical protein